MIKEIFMSVRIFLTFWIWSHVVCSTSDLLTHLTFILWPEQELHNNICINNFGLLFKISVKGNISLFRYISSIQDLRTESATKTTFLYNGFYVYLMHHKLPYRRMHEY